MSMTIVYIVLVILSLTISLNLILTLKLNEKINQLDFGHESLLPVEVDEKIPSFKGKTLIENKIFHLESFKKPSVLIFLSSGCPTCKAKIPEIEAILPLVIHAGLLLKLVSHESKRSMQNFLADSALLADVIMINKKQYKLLNPRYSSPFYLFLNHSAELQAAGFIGDENWLSFISQITNMDTAA